MVTRTRYNLAVGIIVDMVDVYDIAAVTFEKTVIEQKCMFIAVEGFGGFDPPVALQKKHNVFELSFHMLDVGKRNPVGGIYAFDDHTLVILWTSEISSSRQAYSLSGFSDLIR